MRRFFSRNLYTYINEYVQIGVGVLLASIGLKAFLLPNGFLDGGVTGIAILINSLFQLNISILLVIFSLPFLILSYFTVSKRILFKSIAGICGLAISIHYETFEVITEDKLLVAIFGGLFVGMGIGIAIRNGAVLDGIEILGVFLNDRFGIDIGKIILTFNVILFAITATVASVEIAMYSILTFIVTAKVTDFIIEGFEDFIGVMVVSKKNAKISDAIIKDLGAGITVYKGEQGIGSQGVMNEFKIIHTVINRIDIRKIHRIIDAIDENAFIVEFDVNNVKGGVLRRYLSRKKHRQVQFA